MPASTRSTKRTTPPPNPPPAKKPKAAATNANKRASASADTRETKKVKTAAAGDKTAGELGVGDKKAESATCLNAPSPATEATATVVSHTSNASTPDETSTTVTTETTPTATTTTDDSGTQADVDMAKLQVAPADENLRFETLGGTTNEVKAPKANADADAAEKGCEEVDPTAGPGTDDKADVKSEVHTRENATAQAQEQAKVEVEDTKLQDGGDSELEVDERLDVEGEVGAGAKPGHPVGEAPKTEAEEEAKEAVKGQVAVAHTAGGLTTEARDMGKAGEKAYTSTPSTPKANTLKVRAPTTSPSAVESPKLPKTPRARTPTRAEKAEEALKTAHRAWQDAIPVLRAAEPAADRMEVIWLRATSLADAARVKLKTATEAVGAAEVDARIAGVIAQLQCTTCTAEHSIACGVAKDAAKIATAALEVAKRDAQRARHASNLAETERAARLARYKGALGVLRAAEEELETSYRDYQAAIKSRREAGYDAF